MKKKLDLFYFGHITNVSSIAKADVLRFGKGQANSVDGLGENNFNAYDQVTCACDRTFMGMPGNEYNFFLCEYYELK